MAVALFTYDTLADLWAAVIRPWLSEQGSVAAPAAPDAVVLAPDAVRLGEIKRLWLDDGGGPLFGVRFWTPGLLRRHLLEHHFPSLRIATAEDLALAVRLAASGAPEDSPIGVVARDPRAFLAAWDAWLAARADSALIAAPWRPLIPKLEAILEELQLVSVRAADWRLAGLASSEFAPLRSILVDGFTPVHAELFPLLQAAIRQAPAGVCTVPLPHARPVEQAWLGTLETITGFAAEAVPPASSEAGPFTDWARAAEVGSTAQLLGDSAFRLFAERRFEAAAVAGRARSILAAAPASRIGIVLPEEPFLRRSVASDLVRHGFPLHDSFGHFPSASPLERLFGAWVAYQRSGHLPAVQELVDALVSADRLEPECAERLFDTWGRAREMSGSDDFATVTAYLREDASIPGSVEAAAWAARWPRLDSEAALSHFIELTGEAFRFWHDDQRFAEALTNWETTWLRLSPRLERSMFLDWLHASLRVPGRARDPASRDAFAPIQLVGYDAVRCAQWSHLLLAGLNEGLVPSPGRESAFLVAEAGNTHMRRSIVEGEQGEGHETLRPGTGFLLDDTDRRSVVSGSFFDSIAETTNAIECFATYAPGGQDRKATVLSELFTALFRANDADAPFPEVESCIVEGRGDPVPAGLPPISKMAAAYARRCDPHVPFDGDTFGFHLPPDSPLELGARDWEATLSRPASVWLSAIARLRSRRDFNEPIGAGLALGSAVHRLLRLPSSPTWHDVVPLASDWESEVVAKAVGWRSMVERAHAIAGRPLPAAWRESWGRTLCLTRELLRSTLGAEGVAWLASEHALPEGAHIAVADGGVLHLRGRVDALLVDDAESPHHALVIDFKTGADKPLTQPRALKGDGLQLILYGGALAQRWKIPVGLCLLKAGDSPIAQLDVAPGSDPSERLVGLARLGARGVFGFGGSTRSNYRFVGEYPLAFLPPPPEIVEAKWQLTHPDLPLPEGTTE